MDISFVDYDSVRFHLSTPIKKTEIWLSMAVKCWKDLVKYGALDIVEREFGQWLSKETEEGFDVTLKFEVDQVPELGGESVSSLFLRGSGLGAGGGGGRGREGRREETELGEGRQARWSGSRPFELEKEETRARSKVGRSSRWYFEAAYRPGRGERGMAWRGSELRLDDLLPSSSLRLSCHPHILPTYAQSRYRDARELDHRAGDSDGAIRSPAQSFQT